MDIISLYIYCILASSLYTLFNLYNNSWFTFNMSIMHLLHLLSAHFKQSCSENTGAYKPVRFPAPFVITIVGCHVLFSLNMFSYLSTFTLYLYISLCDDNKLIELELELEHPALWVQEADSWEMSDPAWISWLLMHGAKVSTDMILN